MEEKEQSSFIPQAGGTMPMQTPGTNFSTPGTNFPSPGNKFPAPFPSQAPGTNYPAPGTNYPVPGANYPIPQSNYPYPVPGTHYPAPGTNYPAPGTNYPAPGPNYPIPGGNYPVPGTNYPVPGTNYPVPRTNFPIPGSNFSAPVSSQAPGTNFSAPVSNKAPGTNLSAPISSQTSGTNFTAQGTNSPSPVSTTASSKAPETNISALETNNTTPVSSQTPETNNTAPVLSEAPETNNTAPVSSQKPETNFSAPNVSEKRKLPEDEGENNDEDESPPKKQQVDNNENDTSEKQAEKVDKTEKDTSEKKAEGNEDDEAKQHQVAEDICVEYDMPAFFGDDDDEDEEETPEKPDNDSSNVYYSGQGFHEIVEPGNQGTVPCKACNRPFDSYRGLLQHVTHRKLCKELYGAEIEELKLAIKLDPTSKRTDPSSRHKELVECNGCREQFRSLLSHLSKKPQCQVGYDMGLLKAQAEAAQKEKMKQYYRAKNIKDKNKSLDYGDYRSGDSDTHNSSDPSEMVKSIYNEHSNGPTKFTQENSDSNSKSETKEEIPIKQEDINKVAEIMGEQDTSKFENGNSSAAIEAAAAAAAAVATSGQSEDGSGLHPLFPIAGLLHTMQKMNDGDGSTNSSQLTPQQIFLMNFMSRVKTAQAANALANKEIKEDKSKPGPKPAAPSPNITSSPNIASSPKLASTSGTPPNNFQRNGGPTNFGRKVGRSGMFMCARCKTGFINKDTYETHLSKSDCSKPQPGTRYPIKKSSSSGVYVCSKCKQGFIGTEVFEAHLKTHET